jgi:hypothetical protein
MTHRRRTSVIPIDPLFLLSSAGRAVNNTADDIYNWSGSTVTLAARVAGGVQSGGFCR